MLWNIILFPWKHGLFSIFISIIWIFVRTLILIIHLQVCLLLICVALFKHILLIWISDFLLILILIFYALIAILPIVIVVVCFIVIFWLNVLVKLIRRVICYFNSLNIHICFLLCIKEAGFLTSAMWSIWFWIIVFNLRAWFTHLPRHLISFHIRQFINRNVLQILLILSLLFICHLPFIFLITQSHYYVIWV